MPWQCWLSLFQFWDNVNWSCPNAKTTSIDLVPMQWQRQMTLSQYWNNVNWPCPNAETTSTDLVPMQWQRQLNLSQYWDNVNWSCPNAKTTSIDLVLMQWQRQWTLSQQSHDILNGRFEFTGYISLPPWWRGASCSRERVSEGTWPSPWRSYREALCETPSLLENT